MENYIIQNSLHRRHCFTKLRISSHLLAIETGRYTKPLTPVEDTVCHLCQSNSVEDAYHLLITCAFYSKEREIFMAKLGEITNVDVACSFNLVMNYLGGDTEISANLREFVNACFLKRHEKMTELQQTRPKVRPNLPS